MKKLIKNKNFKTNNPYKNNKIKLYILKKYKYIILKNRLGESVEKPQLVNFIAKVLEDSGFKVYKNFKTSQQTVDIYAVLPTSMGDFGMVVACKNYDKEWEVGIDVLKEMEVIGKKLKASKVSVVTSSGFSSQAKRYAEERKIKLVDRNDLVALAKRYNNKKKQEKEPVRLRKESPANIDRDSFYNRDVSKDYIDNVNGTQYDAGLNRVPNPYESYEEYESDIDYYENQVGGIDLSGYSEYDDDLYRAEFLNRHPSDESGYNGLLIANNRDPYVNSKPSSSGRSLFSRNKATEKLSSLNSRGYTKNTNNKSNRQRNSRATTVSRNKSPSRNFISPRDNAMKNYSSGPSKSLAEKIKPILGNTIVSIIVVIVIAYLVAFILGSIVKVPTGYLGLTELAVALVLSYGLVFYTDRGSDVLVKGTIIFFVSLVVLMIILIAF